MIACREREGEGREEQSCFSTIWVFIEVNVPTLFAWQTFVY